jgi:hypothetical protein
VSVAVAAGKRLLPVDVLVVALARHLRGKALVADLAHKE